MLADSSRIGMCEPATVCVSSAIHSFVNSFRALIRWENPSGSATFRYDHWCSAGEGAALDGRDQDNVLLMPFTTVKKRLQGSQFDDVHAVFVAARSPDRDC